MQAIAILFMLCAQVAAPRPGEAFASFADEAVLRAGPTENHVGVLSLPGGSVVRVGAERGSYREVFVASGFPVYLHVDFARVDAEQRRVLVDAERVNARLLPSTVGLLPVGQLGQQDGELELLDEEGDWVRVLAPVGMALYARTEQLSVHATATAQAAWDQAWSGRERARQRRLLLAKAGDPNWLAYHDLDLELAWITGSAPEGLDDAALVARQSALARLARRADELGGEPASAAAVQRELSRVGDEQARRQLAAEVAEAAVRERAQEQARLENEAKALSMGLRFSGRGDAVDIQGVVTRRSSSASDAEVFSISDGRRTFKLSAPRDVTDLTGLVGKTVVLRGRSLSLVSVTGPVLVIDEVLDVRS